MLRADPTATFISDEIELKDDRVIQHIAAFGGIKKEEIGIKTITKESMIALFESIGDTHEDAVSRAKKVGVAATLKGIKCPFTAMIGLGFLHDPDDTGIMTKDGLNETLLNQLLDKAVPYKGQMILTKTQVNAFVQMRIVENRKTYKSPTCLLKMFSPCLRKLGKDVASNGEFKGLWDLFARNRNDAGEKYLTVEEMREFYVNPYAAIARIQKTVAAERAAQQPFVEQQKDTRLKCTIL